MWIQISIAALCVACVVCQRAQGNAGGNPIVVDPTVQKALPCSPPCKVAEETCVKLSRCLGKQCFMCAETSSMRCPNVGGGAAGGMGGGMAEAMAGLGRQQKMAMALRQMEAQMMGGNKPGILDTTPTAGPTKDTTQQGGLFGGNPMTDFLFLSGQAPDAMMEMMGYNALGGGLGGTSNNQLYSLYHYLNM